MLVSGYLNCNFVCCLIFLIGVISFANKRGSVLSLFLYFLMLYTKCPFFRLSFHLSIYLSGNRIFTAENTSYLMQILQLCVSIIYIFCTSVSVMQYEAFLLLEETIILAAIKARQLIFNLQVSFPYIVSKITSVFFYGLYL